MIFTTNEQQTKWVDFLSKYKDCLKENTELSYINIDLPIFSIKLSDKEFTLNKFYLEYSYSKDRQYFVDNFELILIKSFIYNKIDNLIINHLKIDQKSFSAITAENYNNFMSIYENSLYNKIPKPALKIFKSAYISLKKNPTSPDSLDLIELASLIVGECNDIIFFDTYFNSMLKLNGEKLTLFVYFLNHLDSDDFIIESQLIDSCILLAQIIPLSMINKTKTIQMIDLLVKVMDIHPIQLLNSEYDYQKLEMKEIVKAFVKTN